MVFAVYTVLVAGQSDDEFDELIANRLSSKTHLERPGEVRKAIPVPRMTKSCGCTQARTADLMASSKNQDKDAGID